MKQWEEKSEYGTHVHNVKEAIDWSRGFTIHNGSRVPLLKPPGPYEGYDNRNSPEMFYIDRLGYYPEFIAYDLENEVAGQIDRLIIDPPYFDIDDWKTDGQIKKEGFMGASMEYPVSHIGDSNYFKYSIKLSMYAYMVEKMTGLVPRDLFFTHLVMEEESDPNNLKYNILEEVRYDVMYRKWEVENMIESQKVKC